MTVHTSAIDHPARRLIIALPLDYDAARPKRHHSRDGQLAVVLESHPVLDGQPHHRRANVPPRPVRHAAHPLYADADGDTKFAVDQPSLLFASYATRTLPTSAVNSMPFSQG